MRNKVWGWDISTIVHRDVDDELAPDLIIRVRPSLQHCAYSKINYRRYQYFLLVARSRTGRPIEGD